MPFAITAELPLGTYRGAGQDGRPEPLPSVVRLHAALLCAAGFGPRAIPSPSEGLDICDTDRAALRWLEDNPPDHVHIPALEVSTGHAIAHRNDGTIRRRGPTATIKKLTKNPVTATAVSGPFAWIWQNEPPELVRAAIEQLCADVAYLGTSESPVRLTAAATQEPQATHDLDPEAGLFSPDVTSIERPLPGRTDELTDAHQAATRTRPTLAKDRPRSDEKSLSPVPTRRAVETAYYRARRQPAADAPWAHAIVAPLNVQVDEDHRVAWAVAAHRALIKLIGYGAPPLVSGAYPPGTRRPSNRLALQLLGPGLPCAAYASRNPDRQNLASLAILVPADAEPADVSVIHAAVQDLTSIRGPGGRAARIDQARVHVLDGSAFWLPPQPGQIRLWRTVPAAIPDTRGCADWTFAHAALLSLGFVWQEYLPTIGGRGDERYRALMAAACDRGAAVVHVKALRTTNVSRYAHKTNEHAVIRPYTAVLHTGALGGPGTVQAIGQSRHLGGGLLVPFDVTEGTPTDSVSLPASGQGRR